MQCRNTHVFTSDQKQLVEQIYLSTSVWTENSYRTSIVYSTDTQEEDAKRPKVSSRLVDKCAESGVTIAGERLVRTGKAQDRLIWISTTSSQRLDLLEVTTRLNSRSIRHRLTRLTSFIPTRTTSSHLSDHRNRWILRLSDEILRISIIFLNITV